MMSQPTKFPPSQHNLTMDYMEFYEREFFLASACWILLWWTL